MLCNHKYIGTVKVRIVLLGFCSGIFVLDVLGCFPYDVIALAIAGRLNASPLVLNGLEWLQLLALVG